MRVIYTTVAAIEISSVPTDIKIKLLRELLTYFGEYFFESSVT